MTSSIDIPALREVLGNYPTGVSAITAVTSENDVVAMVVGTFSSVSLEPPLVAFMPQKTSSSFARLRAVERFAVNILAHDQEPLCRRLARSDPKKMDGEAWQLSPAGHPVLDGAVAVIECTLESQLDAGDHVIVLGRVTAARTLRPTVPLLFYRGGYGGFAPSALVVPEGADVSAAVVATAETLRADLDAVATRLGGELSLFARIGEESVAVASATPPRGDGLTPLGTRYPLVPPIGVPLIAWSDASDQEAWVARAVGAGDEERDRFRRYLEDARTAGWSVALHEPEVLDIRPGEDAAELRAFEPPARQSRLARRFMRSARYLEVGRIRAGERYPVGAIMAPIFPAGGGTPELMLRLLLFPYASLTGEEVLHRGHALVACARAATGTLGAAGLGAHGVAP